MISFGFELLVIEIIGVIGSNCRIKLVALTPSNFGITISISTKSYFSKFILFTATTPSTATSIVHPKTCRNLLESLRETASSLTSRTRGGTAQPGTNVERRTRSVLEFSDERETVPYLPPEDDKEGDEDDEEEDEDALRLAPGPPPLPLAAAAYA